MVCLFNEFLLISWGQNERPRLLANGKCGKDTRERTDAPAVNPEARSLLHATGATRRLLRHEHRGVALAFPHDLHTVTAQIEHRGRHRAAGTTVDHDVDGMVEQRAIIIRAADRLFLARKLKRA